MTKFNRLPIFYQNAKVTDLEKEGISENKEEKRNFIEIPFYQTNKFEPKIFYKPISKMYILNDE